MAKPIHSMIRVYDLERSVEFYQSALDFKVAQQFQFIDFTLLYMKANETDFELELTFNHDQKQPYEHGNAYGHLAICVEDLHATHNKLTKLALSPTEIKSMQHDNQLMAKFFFLTDPDGYKIEVLERYGRFK